MYKYDYKVTISFLVDPSVFISILMENLFDSESSESDEDSEGSIDDETLLGALAKTSKRDSRQPIRIVNYVERVIPNFSSAQFKSHFRMTPQVFEETLAILGPILSQPSGGRPIKNVKKKLLAVIWLLATPDSFR